MRWLTAAGAIFAAAFGLPAQASDGMSSPTAGLAPLADTVLATATGGAAAALQFGAATGAGAQSLDLTATGSLQASISHSSTHLAGTLTTGEIALGAVSGGMGGMISLQLSTGFNNIQQNSAALAFTF